MATVFGNRLSELRAKLGWSQQRVCDELEKRYPGVSLKRNSYSQYETKGNEPEYSMLVKLADLFGVSVDYLLGRTDTLSPIQYIESSLSDAPELSVFFHELKQRDDLQLLFKQVRPMSPEDIKKIIRVIKAIEDEEAQED
ncbi:helix-turn-helix domain-containing protein [Heliobacterium undosum]|uniref:Helix-turn-helix domain-containing protein n=1 Tax=Heliomicrobium undosum TaxID=121734 RepID=A0A845L3K8_9FIRM|nr:helix-turn-helix transcriptional regulator [Heliomicrobium undosum]MZP31217.1 helix-turn-helix domain-containing protein [Heliomicrobium undosum]